MPTAERDWSIQRTSRTKHNPKTQSDDVYYNYFINVPSGKGKKDKRISLVPPKDDRGGYQNLDEIFVYADEHKDDKNCKIHFRLASGTFTQDKTGEVIPYNVYEVFVITTDNKVISARVKPWKNSDTDLLNNLLGKRTADSINPDEILF